MASPTLTPTPIPIPPTALKLDSQLGALEIGAFLSWALYSATTVQVYMYVQSPKRDRIWLRGLVGVVWGAETLNQIITFLMTYRWTVTYYGDPTALMEIPWTLAFSVLLQGIPSAAVQVFFAYRVYVLSQIAWIAVLPWFICFVRVGSVIAISTTAMLSDDFLDFEDKYTWLVSWSLIMAAATDVWNTAFLVWYLSKQRTGFRRTTQVINKMMMFVLETGLVTSAVSVALTICFVTMPRNFIWLAVLIIYAQVFSNALLASLNNRRRASAALATTTANTNISHSTALRATNHDHSIHVELGPIDQSADSGTQVPETEIKTDQESGVLKIKFKHDV